MPVEAYMKNREIWGKQVVLVPYKALHVQKYHNWMQDNELQRLTSSEPLSLEEEYQMQKTWVNDADKCTFIVLDRVLLEESNCEIAAMIGDVNLFFVDPNVLDEAELSIMIAEVSQRGKGKGKEVVRLIMRFASEVIGVKRFIAKIKYDNFSSQKVFERFGFVEQSRSNIFEEITYLLDSDSQLLCDLMSNIEHLVYKLL